MTNYGIIGNFITRKERLSYAQKIDQLREQLLDRMVNSPVDELLLKATKDKDFRKEIQRVIDYKRELRIKKELYGHY